MPVLRVSENVQLAIGNILRKSVRQRELAEREGDLLGNGLHFLLGKPDQKHKGKTFYWTATQHASSYRLNATEYQPYFLAVELSLRDRFGGVPLRTAYVSPKDITGGATPLGALYPDAGVGFL